MSETKTAVRAGVTAGLLGVLCCTGPLVPILLGIGGAGALIGLHRYQAIFIAGSLLILTAAAWIAVRRHHRCCRVRNRTQDVRIIGTIFATGIGIYLLLQFAVVPVLSTFASRTIQPHPVANQDSAHLATLALDVRGMNCASCAVGIEQALLTVPGVRSAHIDWQAGTGTVRYDPSVATPSAILQAPIQPEYSLRTRQITETAGE